MRRRGSRWQTGERRAVTDLFRLTPGETPVLVNVPHAGTHVPAELARDLTDAGRGVPDTDWHVDRLYEFVPTLGAGLMVASHSRYVVDLNRDPEDRPLYPGADNTEICPTSTFDREAIYRLGVTPDEAAVAARIERYWRPYHTALAAELARLHRRFGVACLLDAHSIRSRVPRFFSGRLPDLNLGSAGGTSADHGLTRRAMATLEAAAGFSAVLDGRFKGGYITRHYGEPPAGRQALQLEMAQAVYMEEAPPWRYRPDLAERIRPTLRRLLEAIIAWAEEHAAATG
jgi:N-formylglutamate deformylase